MKNDMKDVMKNKAKEGREGDEKLQSYSYIQFESRERQQVVFIFFVPFQAIRTMSHLSTSTILTQHLLTCKVKRVAFVFILLILHREGGRE